MKIEYNGNRLCRLVPSDLGPHQFGGSASYNGITPARSKVPLQLVALFDLADPNVPFRAEGLSRIPFYYPFKYGSGGGQVQYEVLNDESIKIIRMSDAKADPPSEACLQVDELPEMRFELNRLSYEEVRAMALLEVAYTSEIQAADAKLLTIMGMDNHSFVPIGCVGSRIAHEHRIMCRNPGCDWKWVVDVMMKLPPITIRGRSEFWGDYPPGEVEFCLGLCGGCGTFIAFNIAS